MKKIVVLGRGISGTVLNHRLIEQGFSVVSIDNEEAESSSRVAAGLWNPVTFKRLGNAWKSNEFIQDVFSFYPEIEKKMNSSFFNSTAYQKVLTSLEQVNQWESRSQETNSFFGPVSTSTHLPIQFGVGTGEVFRTGFLDTEIFIDSSAEYFKKHENIEIYSAQITQQDIELTPNGVMITLNHQTIKADALFFANGLGIQQFDWFSWLPFQPVKGEVLTIKAPDLKSSHILNKGFFIAPIEKDIYRVGATYSHQELNTVPTEKGKKELTDKLTDLLTVPFEVMNHRASVRPAVKGRKPLLGQHPEHKQLYVFNGMGSKAVMMTPHLSKQFLGWFAGKNQLWNEVDVARFYC